MFSLTQFLSTWGASDLVPNPAMPALSTREIGGKVFQFRKADYKARTRMGMAIMGQAEKFAPILKGILPAAMGEGSLAEMPREKLAELVIEFLPELLTKLAAADLVDLIDELVGLAMVDLGDGKFQSLNLPHVAEQVFADDLTLQLPIALSVAEVNLADGFFNQLGRALA